MISRTGKLQLLIALPVICTGVAIFMKPIPQAAEYHQFADARALLGIPNFFGVASNAGFLLVGVIALVTIFRRFSTLFRDSSDARPYLAFFIAITLIAFGSGYYHWSPSNDSLLWDRLPMSMAFMAISAAVVADRINARAGNGWLLAVLLIIGFASLIYWHWSESVGSGDLRFYVLVQFYPMVALPIIIWAFPDHHYMIGQYLIWTIAWYALSKVLEHFDQEIFELTGDLVSGHSLKHLAAAIAPWIVFRMLCAVAERSSAEQKKSR